MNDLKNTIEASIFWAKRYETNQTGWDIGYPSTPLKTYFDQVQDKNLKILISGAGNAYEAEYLFQIGFKNVFVLDIAQPPLTAFQKRVPNFPPTQLIKANFFEHDGQYDLIVEQTFFCSFPPHPTNRQQYAQKMYELLRHKGQLVGLWFSFPLTENLSKPPFGGSKTEYLTYFSPLFEIRTFESCYNSIPPRQGNEYFGLMRKP